MAFLLRAVKRFTNWDAVFLQTDQWLRSDELPAEPLQDLISERGKLSVYVTDGDSSSIAAIVTALKLKAENLQGEVAFVMVDQSDIEGRFEIDITAGDTPDEDVNAWHRDLTDLSASRTIALLDVFWKVGQRGRVLKKSIEQVMLLRHEAGKIDRTRVSSAMQKVPDGLLKR